MAALEAITGDRQLARTLLKLNLLTYDDIAPGDFDAGDGDDDMARDAAANRIYDAEATRNLGLGGATVMEYMFVDANLGYNGDDGNDDNDDTNVM